MNNYIQLTLSSKSNKIQIPICKINNNTKFQDIKNYIINKYCIEKRLLNNYHTWNISYTPILREEGYIYSLDGHREMDGYKLSYLFNEIFDDITNKYANYIDQNGKLPLYISANKLNKQVVIIIE